MTGPNPRIGAGVLALMMLAACATPGSDEVERISTDPALISGESVAPARLSLSETAIWDGRPTLGGVWVAHHDVQEPMRVLIRNTATGKSVTGGLFRQSADNGNGGFTLSSDAASALEVEPGRPAQLAVTAVERSAPATAPAEGLNDEGAAAVQLAENAAPGTLPYRNNPRPQQVAPEPAMTGGEVLRIATFGVEANALAAQARLMKAGVRATIMPGGGRNNPLWAVTAGPARNDAEKSALVAKVKSAGFPDAYFTGQ